MMAMTFWIFSNRDGYRCPRHMSGPCFWDSGTFPCRKTLSVSLGSSCASRESFGFEEEPGSVASKDVLGHYQYRKKPKLIHRFPCPFLQCIHSLKFVKRMYFVRQLLQLALVRIVQNFDNIHKKAQYKVHYQCCFHESNIIREICKCI